MVFVEQTLRSVALDLRQVTLPHPYKLLANALKHSPESLSCAQVRHLVRNCGVKGLDCSAGCGLFLGYGWGIGIMLKPQAAEAMQQSLRSAQGLSWLLRVVRRCAAC